MIEFFKHYPHLIGIGVGLICWGVHLEVKIATTANDVKWIKQVLIKWQQNSANLTP